MSRPLRIEYPRALYHIISRGNARQKIYADENEFRQFLIIFRKVSERYNRICYAHCLMPNHCHLLIETPDAKTGYQQAGEK